MINPNLIIVFMNRTEGASSPRSACRGLVFTLLLLPQVYASMWAFLYIFIILLFL